MPESDSQFVVNQIYCAFRMRFNRSSGTMLSILCLYSCANLILDKSFVGWWNFSPAAWYKLSSIKFWCFVNGWKNSCFKNFLLHFSRTRNKWWYCKKKLKSFFWIRENYNCGWQIKICAVTFHNHHFCTFFLIQLKSEEISGKLSMAIHLFSSWIPHCSKVTHQICLR